MNSITVILGASITIGISEIVIFLFAAILLGFSIHFYWSGRKIRPDGVDLDTIPGSGISSSDEYRLQVYEEIEKKDKVNERLEAELTASRSNEKSLAKQIEDLRYEITTLEDEMAQKKRPQDFSASDYINELVHAQQNLQDHNLQITRLVQQLDELKDGERKHLEILKSNETLNNELRDLRHALATKESEIKHIRQHQLLTKEMNERLGNAYEEFNTLQQKLQKLEGFIAEPPAKTFEYDELQQSYFRLTKECDEIKLRNLTLLEENQKLARIVADSEEKLREVNFQRQQLLKKVAYLEQLTDDLKQVTGHNKKLEAQFRRINEIETMLSRVSQEKQ